MSFVDVVVPEMSSFTPEVKLVKWHLAAGDAVRAGDAVADVENEKAAVAIEAGTNGVLREILVDEGVKVRIGTVIGRIQTS